MRNSEISTIYENANTAKRHKTTHKAKIHNIATIFPLDTTVHSTVRGNNTQHTTHNTQHATQQQQNNADNRKTAKQ